MSGGLNEEVETAGKAFEKSNPTVNLQPGGERDTAYLVPRNGRLTARHVANAVRVFERADLDLDIVSVNFSVSKKKERDTWAVVRGYLLDKAWQLGGGAFFWLCVLLAYVGVAYLLRQWGSFKPPLPF